METVSEWWSRGTREQLALRGVQRTVFVRRAGAGPTLTLLHGFPSSSHDWAGLLAGLAAEHEVLAADFLGFGASEKPREHEHSIAEQADLVEAVWARAGVRASALVAHDYGVTVAQELLARRAQGSLSVRLSGVHFLNGGLYSDVYRPLPGQLALADPELGPQIAAQIGHEAFVEALRATFAEDFDSAAARERIWETMSREDGHAQIHRLIRYMGERERNAERWQGALEATDVPLAFTWGMLDPISGAHMAERVRARLPYAPLTALEDVGHWPMLEAPERVLASLLAAPS